MKFPDILKHIALALFSYKVQPISAILHVLLYAVTTKQLISEVIFGYMLQFHTPADWDGQVGILHSANH